MLFRSGGSLRLAQLGAGEQHFVDPHDIGSALHWRVQGRGVARAVVVVEQLFVPRQASPATFLPLAEETGALVASLRPLGDGEVLRVLASQWRPAILGLRANVSSKAAEAAALAACRGGLVRGAEEVADPHLAEAAMIARWGWVQQCAAGRG